MIQCSVNLFLDSFNIAIKTYKETISIDRVDLNQRTAPIIINNLLTNHDFMFFLSREPLEGVRSSILGQSVLNRSTTIVGDSEASVIPLACVWEKYASPAILCPDLLWSLNPPRPIGAVLGFVFLVHSVFDSHLFWCPSCILEFSCPWLFSFLEIYINFHSVYGNIA